MKLQEISINKNRGFTLIELFIIITIMVIVVSVSIPIYGNIQQSAQVNEVSSGLIQAINLAKNRALSGLNDANHGVYIDAINSSYILYQGINYSARTASYDRVSEYAEILSVTTNLSGSEINFTKVTGEPNSTGIIFISDGSGKESQININEFGNATSE
jgi:Tfp pilus assembly protein FimT